MKKILLPLLTLIISFSIKAQDGPEGILFASKQDANRLTNAYINPAMKGLIYGMNNGWYHTAKVHKKFGFDITIGFNGSIVPSKDEIFSLSNLNSINQPTGNITSATVAGSENDGSQATVTFQENGITYTGTFEMPGGIKEDLPLNAVPAPAIQASMGLPFKSDIILRYVPKVGSDDVKGSLFGIGLKKEITSWFGPMDKTPLHVSLLATYSTMGVDYNIVDENPNDNIEIENGKVDFDLNSYTVQAIASLNFPIINVYGGVGYTGGTSSLDMTGRYTLSYNASLNQRTLTNPLNLDSNASGFKATLGTRLSLGFFKIFADYTLQEYNAINAGIAFSFR
ncbi:hypothetical protein D6T69_14860 [Tenacibaculum singaporense]|uniref:Outer membrane protein beta-barrel domain-containing protein n=1 Tax=Tenacibaculum singaporense TaxID=2358479 RepID=A0A3S8RAJ3_9FLAO|nr:DUF6588 family protein [Tenacibaculum singaporense]AZJ36745.1 hypothetical protein D6T69_14860 [Tenacibaculum singaporense]